jgi:hypothetical protein
MDPLELFNQFIEMFAAQGVDFAAGDESAEERIARLSEELSSGDRTFVDIVDSLLSADVFGDLGVEGKDMADATRIAGELEGGRTVGDLIASLDRLSARDLSPRDSARTQIPDGARLIRITNPTSQPSKR